MSGWIRLHRRIIDSDIYQMPPLYLRVFERLALEANHKDNEIPYKEKGSKVIGKKLIKRGEKLTSVRDICKWVSWYERGRQKEPNPKTVQEILDWLEENHMIDIYGDKGNRKETHYKIVNYNTYQSDEGGKVTENKQLGNKEVTEDKQSLDTNKNVKNEKNKEYIDVFNFYLSLNLVKHRAYTNDMAKAITKAVKDNKYDIEYCKTLLKRHERVVEISKSTDYPVRARGFAEFFGQKVFNATHLICSEYEEGGKYYEQYIKNDKAKNTTKPPLKLIIRDNY